MNNKPWYEKWYYIIGIIAGVFALFGVSVFSIWNYFKENIITSANNTNSTLYISKEYMTSIA